VARSENSIEEWNPQPQKKEGDRRSDHTTSLRHGGVDFTIRWVPMDEAEQAEWDAQIKTALRQQVRALLETQP